MSVYGYDEGAGPQPQQPSYADQVAAIIEMVNALAGADGQVTQQEKLEIEQIRTQLQKLAAGREKEEQDMLGGKMSPAAMARTYNGG